MADTDRIKTKGHASRYGPFLCLAAGVLTLNLEIAMTEQVTPIKKPRVPVETGLRFVYANFTGDEGDELGLYDSLSITLGRAAGLLEVIGESMDENSHRLAIDVAELECRDARAILEAWWRASHPERALEGAS